MVILATRNILSPEQFDEWGWRPFWVSIIMGVSYLIRKNMDESPFCESKIRRTSTNPLKFRKSLQFKICSTALFGATMGRVVWYTGQFYAMSFMKTVMSLDSSQVDTLLGIALILGTPFYCLFG
jgi:hypothetical protein